MVFRTAFLKIEPSTVNVFSIYLIMFTSFVINKWKKISLSVLLFSIMAIFSYSSFAFSAVGSSGNQCGTMCMSNRSFYNYPSANTWYPYRNLQYHSLFGPRQYYYSPFTPSPYRPQMCITCTQRYQRFTHPIGGGANMGITSVDNEKPNYYVLRR